MKATNSMQDAYFQSALTPHANVAAFERSRRPQAAPSASGTGRFDVGDARGRASEIICRIMLALCLGFAFVQSLLQLASF